MKRSARIVTITCSSIAMLFLILDSSTALRGAQEGLILCVQTVIPSLFPFFVLSILLTSVLAGTQISLLRPITRFCKMPKGAESLLLVGFLGGYPIGAKCVYEAWERGQIAEQDAKRCLGFCNNAGPAFIFGMCATLFAEKWIPWVLWGIHILSAMIVGNILPPSEAPNICKTEKQCTSLPEALARAISAMLGVCGWVVLFRVVLNVAQRWFLWLLPTDLAVAFAGAIELANGCVALKAVQNESLRFILCTSFLGFGGLCVALQTISVVGKLGIGMYLPGKAMQCLFSCGMAVLIASYKYQFCSPWVPILFLTILFVALKKTVAFPKRLVYNVRKSCLEETLCCSERKLQSPAATAPVARE